MKLARYHIDGVCIQNPSPVFRPGMPPYLLITALNGAELFVEDEGAYRVSTRAEWNAMVSEKVDLSKLPKPRLTPFPRPKTQCQDRS